MPSWHPARRKLKQPWWRITFHWPHQLEAHFLATARACGSWCTTVAEAMRTAAIGRARQPQLPWLWPVRLCDLLHKTLSQGSRRFLEKPPHAVPSQPRFIGASSTPSSRIAVSLVTRIRGEHFFAMPRPHCAWRSAARHQIAASRMFALIVKFVGRTPRHGSGHQCHGTVGIYLLPAS